MRCSVSFLTVLVLALAVGVMALLIIWFTQSEDYCGSSEESKEFRCLQNGRCLKPWQSCNNFSDCPDGSDEEPMYCHDLVTLNETIDIMIHRDDNETRLVENKELDDNETTIPPDKVLLHELNQTTVLEKEEKLVEEEIKELDVYQKPEICEFLQWNHSTPAVGVKCHGRIMNETLDTIPWDQIDKRSKTISVYFGALNTSVLTGAPGNVTEKLDFPVLAKIFIDHNYIESVSDHAFCNLQNLRWFSMINNSLRDLSPDAFCPMAKLTTLKLSENKLHLKGFHFKNMPQLGIINLEQNEIEEITSLTFSGLPNLQMLNLSYNMIKVIYEEAFYNNHNLTDLDLSHNHLQLLSPFLLQFQVYLKRLYITDNPKIDLPYLLFSNLTNLKSLNIDTLDDTQFKVKSFEFTPQLDLVYFKKFSYCRYVPKAHRCFPFSDGISSNSNLLIGKSRVTVWFIGLITILGNISVLANRWALHKRSTGRTEITKILNIFVTNLAIADLLMGVYLIVLACKDAHLRGMYSVKAYQWGTSLLCTMIGILALISSEVSLLILTIMSLERYLTIGGPFSQRQSLNSNLARATMLIIWVAACMLALAPAIQWPSTGNNAFYGSTGLCFPIHLDDRYPVGWQYTTFMFIGVNSCCLVLITISYSLLFYTVRKTQRRTPLLVKNIELASRFFLMVFTDVLCWAPIIMLKASVLCGYELSRWTVIYVLPLNSAVNPILYTFSTKEVRLSMKNYVNRLLENELDRMIPTSQNHGNSMELQCMTRSIFGGTRSVTRRKDQEQPNTAGTEDTELTHSACPTVSAPESRYWYNSS